MSKDTLDQTLPLFLETILPFFPCKGSDNITNEVDSVQRKAEVEVFRPR